MTETKNSLAGARTRLSKTQSFIILNSRRHGLVKVLTTVSEFGYTRCIRALNSNFLKAQAVINRQAYAAFQARGLFYRAGDHVNVVWTGSEVV